MIVDVMDLAFKYLLVVLVRILEAIQANTFLTLQAIVLLGTDAKLPHHLRWNRLRRYRDLEHEVSMLKRIWRQFSTKELDGSIC